MIPGPASTGTSAGELSDSESNPRHRPDRPARCFRSQFVAIGPELRKIVGPRIVNCRSRLRDSDARSPELRLATGRTASSSRSGHAGPRSMSDPADGERCRDRSPPLPHGEASDVAGRWCTRRMRGKTADDLRLLGLRQSTERLGQDLRLKKRRRTALPAVGLTLDGLDRDAQLAALIPPSTIRSSKEVVNGRDPSSRSFMVSGLEFSSQPGKLGAKPAAGAMKSGLDGGNGDAQALGDFPRPKALGIFQDQQLGVARRASRAIAV